MYTPSLDITVRFQVPAILVWQVIVVPELREGWWPELRFEPKRGAEVRMEIVRPGKRKPRKARGTVIEVDAPEELHFRWTTKDRDYTTTAHLLISQQKQRSKLRVVEEGFPTGKYAELIAAENRDGWREQFSVLAGYLDDKKHVRAAERSLEA